MKLKLLPLVVCRSIYRAELRLLLPLLSQLVLVVVESCYCCWLLLLAALLSH